MGYDIEWKNVPSEMRAKQKADIDAIPDIRTEAMINTFLMVAEESGFYHRESNVGMHAMLSEMRRQGADELADLIDSHSPKAQAEIGSNELLAAVAILSKDPTAPPDHEYVPPFVPSHGEGPGGVARELWALVTKSGMGSDGMGDVGRGMELLGFVPRAGRATSRRHPHRRIGPASGLLRASALRAALRPSGTDR